MKAVAMALLLILKKGDQRSGGDLGNELPGVEQFVEALGVSVAEGLDRSIILWTGRNIANSLGTFGA